MIKQAPKRLLRSQRSRDTASKPCPPRWLWFLAGVFVGVFSMFLFSFQESTPQKTEQQKTTQTKAPAKTESPPAQKSEDSKQSPSLEFEFHDVLSNTGVQVPYSPLKTNTNDVSGVEVSAANMKVLQVGSFRELQSAEGLKNHLNSLGIQAFIQPVTLSDGEHWHRVRVGPFSDFNELNQVSTQLSFHNVSFDVLKW